MFLSEFYFFGSELETNVTRLKSLFTAGANLLLLNTEVTKETNILGFEVFCVSIGVVELSVSL